MTIGFIKSIGEILKDTVDTAMAKARAILQFSQQTGLSTGEASKASQLGMAFGIAPGQLNQQNAFIAGSMGALYGGNGKGDAADLRAYRQMYKGFADQGPIGLMLAQTYEGATGKRGYREAVNYDDEHFEKQMSRASRLEMAPESVTKFGQEFKSIFDTGAMLAENIKVKLAEAFSPLLQKGLDAAISYWETNQDKIIGVIGNIGKWFYVEFPSMLLGGLQFVVKGVGGMLEFMSGAANGFAGMLHGFADLLRGFESGQGGFLEIIGGVLGAFDLVSAGFQGLINVFTFFVNAMGELGNALTLGKMGFKPHEYNQMTPTDFAGKVDDFRNSGQAGKPLIPLMALPIRSAVPVTSCMTKRKRWKISAIMAPLPSGNRMQIQVAMAKQKSLMMRSFLFCATLQGQTKRLREIRTKSREVVVEARR